MFKAGHADLACRALVPKVTIVLFDIDGTLIRTGRAGSRAMDRAFEDLFAIPRAFDGVQMAGRTDKSIVHDGAGRAGISLTDSTFRRFRLRYFERLLEDLPQSGHHLSTEHKRILPGVRPLLEALSHRPDVFLGLLTGNCQEGARIKLEHFDLWSFFRCGAFGDEAGDRSELFPVAMGRVQACGVPPVAPQDVIVVGDTELDVACAIDAGARSVAVATGSSNLQSLRESGADVVVEDLSDTNAFLRLL